MKTKIKEIGRSLFIVFFLPFVSIVRSLKSRAQLTKIINKFMKQKLALEKILISLIVVLILITGSYFIGKNQNKTLSVVKVSDNQRNLQVSENVKKYIENQGQVVQFAEKMGTDFIYVQTIGKECASCRAQTIYVFDKNNKKVFELHSGDPILNWSDSDTFSIIEPIRKEEEPLCCPTEHKTRVFKWNGETFVEINGVKNASKALDCSKVTESKAVDIIKQLPEVKNFLNLPFPSSSRTVVEIDHSSNDNWYVHIYEIVKDTTTSSHTATFNWYGVDKCSGKIKCPFFKYDPQGNLVKASGANEYPCN